MKTISIKVLFYYSLALLLTSCAGGESTLLDYKPNIGKDRVVVIDSECDKSCIDLVKKHVSADKGTYKVGSALILSINGEFGDNTYFDNRGSFNASWDGKYKIKTSYGTKKVLLKPNHWKAHPTMQRYIKFNAEEGSNYFLGNAMITSKVAHNHSYSWTPVVVDKTKNHLVFPAGEAKWQSESISGSSSIYIPIIR